MNIQRFKKLIEAYGTGSERWPEADRHAALIFLDSNLDANEVIRETDATVKLGIKYVNWTDKDYIHNVDNRFYENSNIGQLAGSYIHNYINDESQIDTTDDLIAKAQVPNINQTCSNQYHFNALKLRDYLEKKCRERHIKVYTDEIKDVIQNDNGIDYITGEKQYKISSKVVCVIRKHAIPPRTYLVV